MVGVAFTTLLWRNLFTNVLPEDAGTMMVVVKDTCGDAATFEVAGQEIVSSSLSDWHDSRVDHLRQSFNFDVIEADFDAEDDRCKRSMDIYPSADFYDNYRTDTPLTYSLVVLAIFALTALVFWIYVSLVQQRQVKVMLSATRTNAIVSNLFPEQARSIVVTFRFHRHDHDPMLRLLAVVERLSQ